MLTPFIILSKFPIYLPPLRCIGAPQNYIWTSFYLHVSFSLLCLFVCLFPFFLRAVGRDGDNVQRRPVPTSWWVPCSKTQRGQALTSLGGPWKSAALLILCFCYFYEFSLAFSLVPPTPTTSPAVSSCPTDAGKNCIFPFKSGGYYFFRKFLLSTYEGSTIHKECAPYGSRHWCATSLKDDGSYKDYGYCNMAKCASDGNTNLHIFNWKNMSAQKTVKWIFKILCFAYSSTCLFVNKWAH